MQNLNSYINVNMKRRTFADITEEEIENAIMINEANGDDSNMITIDGLTMKVIDGDFAEYAKRQGATPYKETKISKM